MRNSWSQHGRGTSFWIVTIIVIIVILLPSYLALLEGGFARPSLISKVGWQDSAFNLTQWVLSADPNSTSAHLSDQGGILVLHANGTLSSGAGLPSGSVVAAQRRDGLQIDTGVYRYLRISVHTSNVEIAARVVLWVSGTDPQTVLLKTYKDQLWHTEIVDLSYFGIHVTSLAVIELSFLVVKPLAGQALEVSYMNLTFLDMFLR